MFIEVESGVNLYVEDLRPQDGGNGHTLMFLHGWPGNHRVFDYAYQILPHHRFRCIGLDFRGFGKSDKPWHGYHYDRMAEDLSVVIDMLDLKNVTLVGYSLGGSIAIRYMSKYHHGSKIDKLILVSAAAPAFAKREESSTYGIPLPMLDQLIDQLHQDLPQAITDFSGTLFHRYVSPEYQNWFLHNCMESASYALIQTAVALRDEDLLEDMTYIEVPTGIFHGIHDQIVPFTAAVAIQQEIPGSLIYRFEQSGHHLIYDEKERFLSTLLSFLKNR
ncbi:alpha/beta fold hydrolase [Paenibacillus urinalis]|uniref:Alpha/beta hydrolase n=1 Tax=Paenibacillus urinalis TaxID=521520 RepID=A0AAX3N487_9BACL|nr:alpha/beta hydrolase [Paenibacillus urinalis]WDH84678.1 alpha/beta hydrolase [Paenibacillus urinalis]